MVVADCRACVDARREARADASESTFPMALSGRTPAFGDDRQRVLDATDIVQLIREHVALKNKGREYIALCPFHDDHSPSMYVVPSKQIYHCFSCGAGGNALGFVMNYHRMQFREALEHLAERAGIQLTPRPSKRFGEGDGARGDASGEMERELDRASLLKATATAATFFRAILEHPEHGRTARTVIQNRGISPEMVELFQLGASPDKWDGLVMTIGSKKLALEAFRAVGLVKARENSNGYYDGFRNRLMFPIHDQIGRVIGFGGRRINDEDEPKYINSSESALFDKSTTLYGLFQAAQAIRQSGVALVTEGYMDTIACHQAGVKNAVATLGTALTPGNARVLRRLCNEVVLLFDGDEAGQKAAERAVEVFFAEPIDVRIAMLAAHTDAKDPDELLKREGGRAVLEQALKAAIDPLELLFARMRAQTAGSGLSARSRAIDDYIGRLVELGLGRVDKLRYQLVIKRLAQIADVDYQTIAAMVSDRRAKLRPRTDAPGALGARAGADAEMKPVGQRGAAGDAAPGALLLGCILLSPELTESLGEDQWSLVDPDAFTDESISSVAKIIADLLIEGESADLKNVLARSDDPRVQQAAIALSESVEMMTEHDPARRKRLWNERLDAASRGTGSAQDRAGAHVHSEAAASSPLERLLAVRDSRTARLNDPRAVPRPSS